MDKNNYIIQAFFHLYQHLGLQVPAGVQMHCINRIPLASGMGSSTAALLTGLLGANILLGNPCSQTEILNLATAIEGHPDNISPALYGGLTMGAIRDDKSVLLHQMHIKPLPVLVVLPDISLATEDARRTLPASISVQDAIFNLSRTPFVVEALRSGNYSLLSEAMRDRLHQPYRLPLLPGAQEAFQAAQDAGSIATTLSGAGPGIFVIPGENQDTVAAGMKSAFDAVGIGVRLFHLRVSNQGASTAIMPPQNGANKVSNKVIQAVT